MYITRSFTSVQMCLTHTPHTQLTHTRVPCCTRQSFTISFLFPAFPMPSLPFFCCLLEEVDMWVIRSFNFFGQNHEKKGSGSNFKPSNPSMLVCLKTLEPEPSTTLKQKPAKESHPGKPKKQTPVSSVFVSKQIREKITHGFPKCQ